MLLKNRPTRVPSARHQPARAPAPILQPPRLGELSPIEDGVEGVID